MSAAGPRAAAPRRRWPSAPSAPRGRGGPPAPPAPSGCTTAGTIPWPSPAPSWSTARSPAEHGFRFLKQDLGWTPVRPRHPHAADRWSWLLALALWLLWLAREGVADRRLPWERPLPPDRLTPGRVRRALASDLPWARSPARPVRRRGISPGRRPGQCPGPPPRYPVARRRPKRAA